MRINIISLGHKPPAWIKTAYAEYAKRFPKDCAVHLIEIPPRTLEVEILKKIPLRSTIIALDERGELWDTLTVAKQMKQWQMSGKDITLLIGGAEGLSQTLLKKADKCWSLSPLTFPHLWVRLIVVEQLYRALSLLSGHPYHRGNS